MIGGLWKSTSTAALFAAAGLFVGGVAMPSAKAADLGGDCCADLEERVAELEATTARKGNRRMSLTVSGQVTRSILYWNDGDNDDVYAGLDNHNQSTRFTFSGSARISPNVTAGFEFMTEWAVGARTSSVDQLSPDGSGSGFLAGDATLAVRTANWWLEDKHLGRVTVGRLNVGGPVGTIDLGGISTVAHFSPGLVGGGFFVTGIGGARLAQVIGPTYGGDRIEGIRWDSPNWGGFVLQGTWGEDEVWAASLRYAGEFAGFRVAAGIGYEAQDESSTQAIQLDNGARNIDHEWSGSLALMHVPSGLFAQGHYAMSEFLNGEEGTFWMVQAGITKNWFGLGNTSFYGEYGEAEDYIKSGTASTAIGAPGFAATVGLPDASSEVTFFGLGVVQQIDAAAMEVYLGWRRFETDVDGAGALNGSSDLDLVHGGARIRF
jgi:Gram-negative porin